ncbi:MAG TPA: Asp23/Gls24 family envelope stress response protein [Actinobacteria bacterium]|nr:Asp23/Gls24 family envelope stress response protein [Actinomycetota bacterium]
MPKDKESAGKINVANDVIADLAGYAAFESYGVVGMASPNTKAGVAQLLTRDKLKKGIKIDILEDGTVEVGLYVIIEYGTNLSEVVRNLAGRVKHEIEKYARLKVSNVDVHIQGVKIRK